jgi:hypothetical protein
MRNRAYSLSLCSVLEKMGVLERVGVLENMKRANDYYNYCGFRKRENACFTIFF